MNDADSIAAAAARSLRSPTITGQSWLSAQGHRGATRFTMNPSERSVAMLVNTVLAGDAGDAGEQSSWQRVISIGTDAFMWIGQGDGDGDPLAVPDQADWLRFQGPDFPASGPQTPLYWLLGATSAAQDDSGTVHGTLHRARSLEMADAVDRPGLEDSWHLFEAGSGATGLAGADYSLRLDSAGRVALVELTVTPQHIMTTEFAYLDEAVSIVAPDEAQYFDAAEVMVRLGRPDAVPPSLAEGTH
ncbi:hypothetical protein BW730_02200 [Tessaracoccus aquimaris]|uniref:Uncharacterized protein n=1 Tax=Tessaracoccus aquimaris TaxID=1332264 RepID=A0A1Q2CKG2_9ACTN|nr:hypothetical protein [Tessaracoccus aquimaris]AQP46530.1 hypothetical protein BW730_02200 [Tessaracoccus aquimaris]